MLAREQQTSKKLLAISVGIIAVLFIIIVLLIMRAERFRRASVSMAALPELAEDDQAALNQLRAFGSILEDHGWQVQWNPPVRYEREGTLHLQRGSFHNEFPDLEGEPVQLGVDALTFAEDATLPPTDTFPLEKWRDLHPLRAFTADDPFPSTIKRAGRTYFVFYQYNKALPPNLPNQFEAFVQGDSRQRATFRRELTEAYQKQKQTLAAIKTIQKALLDSKIYEGKLDGVYGWQTKHALQRFLREQGFYSGDIDGVYGNRTLQALNDFRAKAGLEKNHAIDPELATAIVNALSPQAAPSSLHEDRDLVR
ncbi:MAG: hypothetical protein ACI8T1_000244 [Verrucomicrobiales bacterium]